MSKTRGSPRKFSEKIALLNLREQKGTAEFEKIIKEVEQTTKAPPILPRSQRNSFSASWHDVRYPGQYDHRTGVFQHQVSAQYQQQRRYINSPRYNNNHYDCPVQNSTQTTAPSQQQFRHQIGPSYQNVATNVARPSNVFQRPNVMHHHNLVQTQIIHPQQQQKNDQVIYDGSEDPYQSLPVEINNVNVPNIQIQFTMDDDHAGYESQPQQVFAGNQVATGETVVVSGAENSGNIQQFQDVHNNCSNMMIYPPITGLSRSMPDITGLYVSSPSDDMQCNQNIPSSYESYSYNVDYSPSSQASDLQPPLSDYGECSIEGQLIQEQNEFTSMSIQTEPEGAIVVAPDAGIQFVTLSPTNTTNTTFLNNLHNNNYQNHTQLVKASSASTLNRGTSWQGSGNLAAPCNSEYLSKSSELSQGGYLDDSNHSNSNDCYGPTSIGPKSLPLPMMTDNGNYNKVNPPNEPLVEKIEQIYHLNTNPQDNSPSYQFYDDQTQ